MHAAVSGLPYQKKEITFLVRLYDAGAMSSKLRGLKVGDELDISGPFDGTWAPSHSRGEKWSPSLRPPPPLPCNFPAHAGVLCLYPFYRAVVREGRWPFGGAASRAIRPQLCWCPDTCVLGRWQRHHTRVLGGFLGAACPRLPPPLFASSAAGSLPVLGTPSFPLFHCSIVPLFHCSIVPLFHCSIVPLFHCSIVPLFHCSIVWKRDAMY
jgi:hypothetical protein